MSDERFLFRFQNNLSTIINQPLQTSNRIKFTCFDVSLKHIAFGATSGGIYIYNRKPCSFLKLLPSKEGAITNVLISDNDKIAISTNKGLILISLHPFSNHNGEFLVFTEHENNNVTTIKWYKNLLYTGDHAGNVAVIDVSTTFKKSLFKVPSALLMKLDSSIVQLDIYWKYLLISTETKTFLCDTNEEHYKQIGKKLRNGPFGCCFLNLSSLDNDIDQVKIICARPGCRLWEANFTCQVIRTQQFKEALIESKSTYIYISEDDTDVQIKLKSNNLLLDFGNFKYLHVIDNKFLLTFNSNGIYVFDIDSIRVSSWICDVDFDEKIKDVKIVDNYIYIWTEDSDIILLLFSTLDNVLRIVLSKKQFNVCSKICLYFKDDLLQLVDANEELHLLHLMKSYLEEKQEHETLEQLNFLFSKLDVRTKSCILENGIHVLKNLNIMEGPVEGNSKGSKHDSCELIANGHNDPFSDVNYNLNILYKNYKTSSVDMRKNHKIFASKSLSEIVHLLQQFVANVHEIEPTQMEGPPQLWCYNHFLYYIQESRQNFVDDEETTSYVIDAFKALNKNDVLNCSTCSFPLPNIRKVPKYYNVGCEIVNLIRSKEDTLSNFLIDVPYMWKHLLNTKDFYNDLLLPIIIQFSDEDVLNNFVSKFTYDNWDCAIRLLIKLKNKICLNCEKNINFDDTNSFNWTKFCITMSEHIGSISSIKLLTRYADRIDSNQIGMAFYQTCIFNTIVNNYRGHLLKESTEFMRNIHNDKSSANEISNLLNKYLIKKHLMPNNEERDSHSNKPYIDDDDSECTFCKMPLSTPVLKDLLDLNCGHPYHKVCFMHLNKICIICTNV